ncbi:unnamed protein product [Pleuronectes platessa]|uniref:Uncharacterized protein n=1 Tax=Pleuronectes platessa TaxID=8262 RepID=A0A9N7VZ35_PLEPL|nr:unnamed protein product [Pleuronectes platessa]
MAARSRITVLLLIFLLSTEHSFAVNLNELAPLVNKLLSEYRFNGMFSLAVSIPLNQDQNKNQNQNQGANQIIQEVLKSDHAANVKNKINKGEVYIGSRVVAAEVRRLEKAKVRPLPPQKGVLSQVEVAPPQRAVLRMNLSGAALTDEGAEAAQCAYITTAAPVDPESVEDEEGHNEAYWCALTAPHSAPHSTL